MYKLGEKGEELLGEENTDIRELWPKLFTREFNIEQNRIHKRKIFKNFKTFMIIAENMVRFYYTPSQIKQRGIQGIILDHMHSWSHLNDSEEE